MYQTRTKGMRAPNALTSEQRDALQAMRDGMAQEAVNRQLAATALQRTVQLHKVAAAKAKAGHKRRPRVTLA